MFCVSCSQKNIKFWLAYYMINHNLLFNNGDGGVYVDSGDNSGHSDDNGSNNDVNINGDSNNNINDDNITMLGIVVASNYLY